MNRSAAAPAIKDKGLKKDAISLFSNTIIGVSSAAPAYSLASALGIIAGFAQIGTPAIMVVAFLPMLFVACAYFYLNKADPDCGTVFSWVTRAMGPGAGWIGGWALIVTNILVMPSLAAIAGQYTFQLFGYGDPSDLEVTLAGVAWIAVMTTICYLGIELSARAQQVLLGLEVGVLAIFAAVALFKVYGSGAPPQAVHVAPAWFNPIAGVNPNEFSQALLAAVFIYWGWDSGVSVNEETKNSAIAPGFSAVASTILLVAIYVFVAVAAIAFAGPELLSKNSANIFAPLGKSVLGPELDKLLILAVLTSASASTQTTILPAARTALSMASAGAIPSRFGEIHTRYLTPSFATLVMGGISIVWFAGLTALSKNVIDDSVLALGLCIAFYYGLTGFACAIFYRHELLNSVRNFILLCLLPLGGGIFMLFLFIQSCFALKNSGSSTILGIGAPLVIGLGALFSGLLPLGLVRLFFPAFFKRKRETADLRT